MSASEIKIGDRVVVRDRPDWPTPPGYPMAGTTGIVIDVSDAEGIIELKIESTKSTLLEGENAAFRFSDIESFDEH